MEKEILEYGLNRNRHRFLSRLSLGIGSVASLLIPDLFKGKGLEEEGSLISGVPHFAPKAKRVIYLFQNGAPSQLESFDYKPKLRERIFLNLSVDDCKVPGTFAANCLLARKLSENGVRFV